MYSLIVIWFVNSFWKMSKIKCCMQLIYLPDMFIELMKGVKESSLGLNNVSFPFS